MIPPSFHAETAPPQTAGQPESHGGESCNGFDLLLAAISVECGQTNTTTERASLKCDHDALSTNDNGNGGTIPNDGTSHGIGRQAAVWQAMGNRDSIGSTQGLPNPPVQTPAPLASPSVGSSAASLGNLTNHNAAGNAQGSPNPPIQTPVPFTPPRAANSDASPSNVSNHDWVDNTQGSPNPPIQTSIAPVSQHNADSSAAPTASSDRDLAGDTQRSRDPSVELVRTSIALAPPRAASSAALVREPSNHDLVGNTQGPPPPSARPVQIPDPLAPPLNVSSTGSLNEPNNRESVGNMPGPLPPSPQVVQTLDSLVPPPNASATALPSTSSNHGSVANTQGPPPQSSQPIQDQIPLAPPSNANSTVSRSRSNNRDLVGNTPISPDPAPQPVETSSPSDPPRNASDVALSRDRLAADPDVELHTTSGVAAIHKADSKGNELPLIATSDEVAVGDPELVGQETKPSHGKTVSAQDAANPFPSQATPGDASSTFATRQTDSPSAVVKLVSDTIVSRAQLTAKGQGTSLEVQLDPPELGRVVIHLEQFGDDRMNARLIVSEDAARAVLERELVELRHTLEENGIALNQLNVACQGERSEPQTTWQRDELRFAGRRARRNGPSKNDVTSRGPGTIDVRV